MNIRFTHFKKFSVLFILWMSFFLYLSCNGEKEIVSLQDTQTNSPLIGNWDGYGFFGIDSNGVRTDSGYVMWDYNITADSIFSMDYPFNIFSASKSVSTEDSIIYMVKDRRLAFAWAVNDTLLSLVGGLFPGRETEKDSFLFVKADFSDTLVDELKTVGFNKNILESNYWFKEKEQYFEAKAYLDKVPERLAFSPHDNYLVSKDRVRYVTDTFSIYMSDSINMLVEKVFGNDTVGFRYRAGIRSIIRR